MKVARWGQDFSASIVFFAPLQIVQREVGFVFQSVAYSTSQDAIVWVGVNHRKILLNGIIHKLVRSTRFHTSFHISS